MRRWVKFLISFIVGIALCAAALVALKSLNEWRYDNAVAAAEAWNVNEWENGTALRATTSFTIASFDSTRERGKSIVCHRKQHVSGGSGLFRTPKTEIIYRALGYRYVFSTSTGTQDIHGLPTPDLCRRLFLEDITPPKTLDGQVIINNNKNNLSGIHLGFSNHLNNTCALNWDTQGRFLLRDLDIAPVVLTQLEKVPMQRALEKFDYMGSAEAIDELFLHAVLGRKDQRPANFEWDRAQRCWVRTGDAACENRVDDLCEIPKF